MKRARPAGAICVAHQPTPLIRSNLSARSALICALVAASAACGSDPVAKSDASADETVGSADGVANEADSQSDAAELDSSAVDDTSVASETSTEDTTPSDVACKSDKDCLALDQVCNKTAGFCVQCNDSNDCGDDETCKGNSCVGPPQKCASSKDCADANQLCDKVAGICVECVTVDDCAAGQSCQDTVCVDVACKPGATGCKDATTLSICADDGLSAVSVPCPTGQGCAEGTCTTATVCKPGASACEGQLTLLSCNGDGSAWIKTPCEVKHLCATKGGSSLCEAATCTPGALVCVGDKIAECSSTGEPSDISDDCALKGKTCEAGLCVDKPVGVCSSGSKLCEGDSAKVCKADGGAWENVDCTVDSKVCKDGACVAPPPVCTAGELGCDGGATKTVCKADGSGWDATPCGSQSACSAGVCEKTLCTPGAHDCVDGKTEKSCAPDGKSWTDVTTCATTNSCAEVSCQANVGCPTPPLADGASCGGGKICASGACVAPSGCQLCGPAQTCVSGQCQACTPVDVPVYVGAIRTFTPPAEQLPGPMQLVYSPKHAEWWLVYNHQLGKPGKIVRYNKDWSSTGKEFALPPYTRSIAVLPDGDFVMAILPNSGNSWLKRFKALSQDVVWSKEVTWGRFWGLWRRSLARQDHDQRQDEVLERVALGDDRSSHRRQADGEAGQQRRRPHRRERRVHPGRQPVLSVGRVDAALDLGAGPRPGDDVSDRAAVVRPGRRLLRLRRLRRPHRLHRHGLVGRAHVLLRLLTRLWRIAPVDAAVSRQHHPVERRAIGVGQIPRHRRQGLDALRTKPRKERILGLCQHLRWGAHHRHWRGEDRHQR